MPIVVRTSGGIRWDYLTVLELWTKRDQRQVILSVSCHQNEIVDSHVTGPKLYTATLDNTGNNNTTCQTIQDVHERRGLEWNSNEQQLPYVLYFQLNFSCIESSSHSCLGHVVNLGNVDVMARITKIAAVKNATAIWEYDPTRPDNRVLGGSLDVIAAIRTLAIKVSMS